MSSVEIPRTAFLNLTSQSFYHLTMAVSNKTIIALALLAIAVAVVAESQGTMRPECVVGVRGVQCGAQLSLCVCAW